MVKNKCFKVSNPSINSKRCLSFPITTEDSENDFNISGKILSSQISSLHHIPLEALMYIKS